MYAFNKRFRPTLYKGFTIEVLMSVGGGFVFLGMCGMAIFNAHSYLTGLFFFLLSALAFYLGFKMHIGVERRRLSLSLLAAKGDLKRRNIWG